MDQLQGFGLNIIFLLGVLVFVGFCFMLLIAFWTGVKIMLLRRRQKQSDMETRRRKFHLDGRPIPPSAPGICHKCGSVFPQVHHLSDGRRLCVTCYQSAIEP
ncbi:MAG: hypothetical protein MI923_15655 [Phycisphaerales bacterium]|nr:hypothetical protein [Phycisphaerales bacterium]